MYFFLDSCFFPYTKKLLKVSDHSVEEIQHESTTLKWNFSGSDHFTYFVDTRLPYRGRRAPGIFNHLTLVVKQIMARRGYKMIIVYLDDFLIIAHSFAQ